MTAELRRDDRELWALWGWGLGAGSHLEVWDLVPSPQRDLEYFHGADERCEPRQTLLAAPTHAHQQRISPGGLKDAVDVAAAGKEQRHVAWIRLSSVPSPSHGLREQCWKCKLHCPQTRPCFLAQMDGGHSCFLL